MIDLTKHNKAEVLATLYNNSRPLGMGILHFMPEEMTIGEAENLLKDQSYFDYLMGRVMKCDFSGDKLETFLYNRDNGKGAAELLVEKMEIEKEINKLNIQINKFKEKQ